MKKLQDFIKSTIDNRGKNPDRYFEDEKYPVIDNVLIKNTLYPDMSAVTRYIDQDTFDNFLRGYVHKNMPLITLVGNGIGNVTLAPSDEVAIVQNTIGFEVTAELDEVFLYYYLRNNQERIRGFNRGSGQPSIKKTDILSMEVDFPIIDIQKKIVNVLMRIDEKIENNNAINRNLQEQAQAIFSKLYWEATAQSNFKSMINVLGGGTPKTGTESFWNGEIPFFTPKDVGAPYTFETEKTITDDGLAHCNSRLYPVNTTFVTARGTVGKVALAGVPMAMNQSCYALASDVLPALMVYFYSLEVVKSLKHKASGAVFDAIVTRDFDSEIIRVLGNAEQAAFMDIAGPAFEQIHKNTMENQRLQTIRDGLLPKLMSGELDVSDIDI